MYGGDPDGAIAMLHSYESAHPDDPVAVHDRGGSALVEDVLRRGGNQMGNDGFAEAGQKTRR